MRFEYYFALGAFVWLVLLFTRRTPEVRTMKHFISALNDRGGNILVLLVLTLMFFQSAMGLFYHAMGLMEQGRLTAENAVLLMGLQFVTGTAFGGAFGALLKTMNPSTSRVDGRSEPPPTPPGVAGPGSPEPVSSPAGPTVTPVTPAAATPVVRT